MVKNAATRSSAAATEAAPSAPEPGPYEPLLGRIPILELSPQVDEGLWAATAFSGEVIPFRATAFREGHDKIGVDLILLDPAGQQTEHHMHPLTAGTDRWEVEVQLDQTGLWRYRVQAYADEYATWHHNAEVKVPAGIDVELMLRMGHDLLVTASKDKRRSTAERRHLSEAAKVVADINRPVDERFAAAVDERIQQVLTERPVVSLPTLSATRAIQVERTRAGVGSWYEFFPRSEGAKQLPDGSWKSGTFRTAAKRLPEVAAMGFDVVYLPPIHPIGRTFRKGPNNTLDAGENDPGSPWAIGSAEGGHDAIHPDLGTEKDFVFFLGKAKQAGLEVALDLALQASPDHPWVTEHPEWFTTLPDGTIAYAENPPKKYQDIYPINFDNDYEGLRQEVLRIVRHWMSLGVRIFRVDNPHTKPLHFWEWLIHTVNATDPDAVFLAEAFTRPALLRTLAKAGFQQSYTYFTWRNTKEELEEFLHSLAHETADYLRPNLFVNTPDILTEYLQFGGPAAFKVRAAIAATAAPSWGVYSGYELFENVARPGAEEYIDNEKYEYRPRDYARAQSQGRSLAGYLTMLNRARSEHPALRQLRNLHLHYSEDDSILVYSKYLDGKFTRTGKPDAVIVVANVDPHSVRETIVHLDVTALGLPLGSQFEVKDRVTGQRWTWGADDYVRLDAFTEPVHILAVRPL
ncbi:starch synthase (maltosyl-transferring) [Leifsonia sp. 98AMF]|nr:starch synthase (maltosyl-transferring) [Leifsonia sp. 197AMF]SDJ06572.1 starch synthase (maltosyl-transferring) [Leifsonia sp. 466MF]SDJ65164.1 alpha-1,4-glucan:maltose-1-phosphate maltosyltransferase [Leifsonia sp. 157MF]SDN27268.1 starch synthase (maltosyl-transferring) [Leifsonia sp. 509MF]SEM93582.1 starch synthase (maltosyl-transferring) [Leifsonia sp. 467MF]SFM29543.1 starch synthase (maltosyl-transferring) [Leifsonia sp. 98AMF]